jgi:5,10-methylenetetrahydromethanopterin reductase
MARFLSVVAAAEAKGLGHVWVLDSQTLYQNAYVTLALVANATRAMGLGPGVTNLVTRHETVVANAMSTLASLAPGRVVVGLGTGDSAVRPLGLKPPSLAEFQDRVGRLRALLRGEAIRSDGRDIRVVVVADPPPRIFVAATRPRMLEMAGAIADGVIVVGAADPGFLRMQLDAVDTGARRAGRRPEDVERDLWLGLAIGEGREPVTMLASYASTQARLLLGWPDLPPSLAELEPEMRRLVAGYDFREHLRVGAAHGERASEQLVRTIAIAGTLDEARARLNEILELRPSRISVTLLPRGRERRLEEIAELWATSAGTTAGVGRG